MNKVNWLVDTLILESRNSCGDLLSAIKKSGHNLYTTWFNPLKDVQDYGPTEFLNSPTILYGTIGYANRCKRPLFPGAYGFGTNVDCDTYYTTIPNEHLLNEDYYIFPFYYIQNRTNNIFKLFDGNSFFIRPVKGKKAFTGQVLSKHNYKIELNSLTQLSSVMPTTLCLVSSTKNIQSEYRFLIGKNEVIDGSEYRWDNILDIRHDYDMECFKLAEKVARLEWQSDSVYTVDIGLWNGEPKIIELNSFSTAGLYQMNLDLVIDRVSEISYEEFYNL